MEYLRKVSVKENACNLCFDHIANVRLLPCEHWLVSFLLRCVFGDVKVSLQFLYFFCSGFCSTCADQLSSCPMCRHAIENKITMFEADFDVTGE